MAFRTLRATAVRRTEYKKKITAALPQIRAARAAGAKCARDFVRELNSHGVPAPNHATWTESAVLRAFRRLKALKLDEGSRVPSAARTSGPRRARVGSDDAIASIYSSLPPSKVNELERALNKTDS